MPLNRRVFEPRPLDNGSRQRSAIGIAAVVLVALALWLWTNRAPPAPPIPPPAAPALVRLRR